MIERGVSYASSLQETEYSFKQALRTSTYWLMIIGFTVHNFIAGGFNVHVFPFLTDIGIDEAAAGWMMGVMIFFTIPSRFFGGIIADRIPKRNLQLLLVAAFLLQVIGISSFLLSREYNFGICIADMSRLEFRRNDAPCRPHTGSLFREESLRLDTRNDDSLPGSDVVILSGILRLDI